MKVRQLKLMLLALIIHLHLRGTVVWQSLDSSKTRDVTQGQESTNSISYQLKNKRSEQ